MGLRANSDRLERQGVLDAPPIPRKPDADLNLFGQAQRARVEGFSSLAAANRARALREGLRKGQKGELETLLAADPRSLTSEKIQDTLTRFKTTLLGGQEEGNIDVATQTLLSRGEDLGKKLAARLKVVEKQQEAPGAQAQTTVATTSLLG